MIRLFLTLSLCSLLLLFPPCESHAAQGLKIGISTGYPPYYSATGDGYSGICIDLLEEAATMLDVEIVYHEYPWKRMLLKAKQGKVDAIMPLFRTEERETYLEFSDLILAREEVNLFTRVGTPLTGLPPQLLYAYPIGVVSGYSYGEQFDSRGDIEKVVCRSDQHLLRMFQHDRFDVGVGNRYVVDYYARRLGLQDDIRFIQPAISLEPLYLAFSKKSEKGEMVRNFSRVLRKLRNSETYRAILERYGITGTR